MKNQRRCWRLPQLIFVLSLLMTIGAEAQSDRPVAAQSSPATQASAEFDPKQELLALREIVASMPNAQAAQLIITTRSLMLTDVAQAEQLCRQALALLVHDADQPHRWGVLYLLGQMVHAQGRASEAGKLFREAHAVALKYYPPDSTAVFETTGTLASITVRTDPATALTLALQAEPLIERKNVQREPLDLAVDRILVAEVFYDLQELDRSEKLLLAVVEDPDYERLGAYHRARVLGRLGMINNGRENTTQATSYLEQSLKAWKDVQINPAVLQEIGVNHLTLGQLYLEKPNLARAEQQFKLATDAFTSTGRSDTRAKALTMLGNTLLIQHRDEEARDALAEGYGLHKKNKSDGMAFAAGLYGHVLLRLKAYPEAVSAFRDAQSGYSLMRGHEADVVRAAYQRGIALWMNKLPCDSRNTLQEAQALLVDMSVEESAKLADLYTVANDILNMPNAYDQCPQPSAR